MSQRIGKPQSSIRVAQGAANRVYDEAKTVKEKVSKFEARYVVEVGGRREKVGKLTRQF